MTDPVPCGIKPKQVTLTRIAIEEALARITSLEFCAWRRLAEGTQKFLQTAPHDEAWEHRSLYLRMIQHGIRNLLVYVLDELHDPDVARRWINYLEVELRPGECLNAGMCKCNTKCSRNSVWSCEMSRDSELLELLHESTGVSTETGRVPGSFEGSATQTTRHRGTEPWTRHQRDSSLFSPPSFNRKSPYAYPRRGFMFLP